MRTPFLSIGLISFILCGCGEGDTMPRRPVPEKPAEPATQDDGASDADAVEVELLSAMAIQPTEFGERWTAQPGVVIDDFSELHSVRRGDRQHVAMVINEFAGEGVVAAADFSYRVEGNPLQLVTVRLFRFADAGAREAYWQKKYQADGWEETYTMVADLGYDAMDVNGQRKRAVGFDDLWITCHQIHAGEQYLTVLEAYIERAGQTP